MGARNLLLAPSAIYNLVTPLLTDCTGNSSETVFFALEASKILRQLQVFHTAFLFSLLPLLSRLSSGIKKINLQQKQINFALHDDKSRTVLAKATVL